MSVVKEKYNLFGNTIISEKKTSKRTKTENQKLL